MATRRRARRPDPAGVARRDLHRPLLASRPGRADELRSCARSASSSSLDASVGIGPNRLVAKVASDAEKPCGFVVLTREQAAGASRPSRRGCYRGSARRPPSAWSARRQDDRRPAGAPARRARAAVRQSHGRALHERAHFRDDSAVARGETKSRSVETTFDYDIADLGGSIGSSTPVRAASLRARASAGSAAARSGSRSASTTGPRSPACTRSRRRPTTPT